MDARSLIALYLRIVRNRENVADHELNLLL